MSVVFYKFRSAKDYNTCTFDGSGIAVFELKREIMLARKLGKGADFDLALYDAATNEELADDAAIVQRNSSVLVARNPPSRPGKGTAQRYLLAASASASTSAAPQRGQGRSYLPSNPTAAPARTDYGINPATAHATKAPGTGDPSNINSGGGDSDMISLMLQQEAENWRQTQDQMATQRPVFRPGGLGRGAARGPGFAGMASMSSQSLGESRPPPPGYICYRCGQKGHYINQCPTIGDKSFDNRPKLKRTTGIPKAFLKSVDPAEAKSGQMVTQTGEIVIAAPNDYAWSRLNAQRRTYLGVGDAYDLAPVLPELQCAICQRLLQDAVTAPCCNSNFCDECIRHELLESHDPDMKFKCPKCQQNLVPDVLMANKPLRKAVEEHLRDFAAKVNAANERDSPVPESKPSTPVPTGSTPTNAATEIMTTSASSSPVASTALPTEIKPRVQQASASTKAENSVDSNVSPQTAASALQQQQQHQPQLHAPLPIQAAQRAPSSRPAYSIIHPPSATPVASASASTPSTSSAVNQTQSTGAANKDGSNTSRPYRIIDPNSRPPASSAPTAPFPHMRPPMMPHNMMQQMPAFQPPPQMGMPQPFPFIPPNGGMPMFNPLAMLPMHGVPPPGWHPGMPPPHMMMTAPPHGPPQRQHQQHPYQQRPFQHQSGYRDHGPARMQHLGPSMPMPGMNTTSPQMGNAAGQKRGQSDVDGNDQLRDQDSSKRGRTDLPDNRNGNGSHGSEFGRTDRFRRAESPGHEDDAN